MSCFVVKFVDKKNPGNEVLNSLLHKNQKSVSGSSQVTLKPAEVRISAYFFHFTGFCVLHLLVWLVVSGFFDVLCVCVCVK